MARRAGFDPGDVRRGGSRKKAARRSDTPEQDADFLQRMRSTLESAQQEILAKVAIEHDEYHRLLERHRIGDLSDRALEALGKERLAALELQDRERLRLVAAALMRLRDGRYGICDACGGKISRRRLEALPEALLCISCQRRLERTHSRTLPRSR
jgi:DnaK suppressor protein